MNMTELRAKQAEIAGIKNQGVILETSQAVIVLVRMTTDRAVFECDGIYYRQLMEPLPGARSQDRYWREGIMLAAGLDELPKKWTKEKGRGYQRHSAVWFVDQADGRSWFIGGYHEQDKTAILTPAGDDFRESEDRAFGPRPEVGLHLDFWRLVTDDDQIVYMLEDQGIQLIVATADGGEPFPISPEAVKVAPHERLIVRRNRWETI